MRLIISFLFLLVLNTGVAQHKKELTEEEYIALKDKIRFSLNENYDVAFQHAEELLQSNNAKHLAFANGAISYIYQLKGNTAKSDQKYKLAFSYLNKMPESEDKTRLNSYLLNYRGLTQWKRGNFSEALDSYQEGIKFSTKIGDVVQIVKFKSNIALLNEAVGNYELSIKILKQNDNFLDQNENLYEVEQFQNSKSNMNTNLGNSYEGYFMKNRSKRYLLDSAEFYYKRAITFSEKYTDNKITSKLSLGNIYLMKNDYANAEKLYYDVVFSAKQDNNIFYYQVANYNLADLYYALKKYDKALVFLNKVDSIEEKNNLKSNNFLKSNYLQAKIYNFKDEPELAYKHSKIYLDAYEKYEGKMRDEAVEVNYKLGVENLGDEMFSIQEKYKYEVFWNKALKVFYVLLFVGIVFLLVKNIRDKNKAHKKMNALIEEFKANLEKKEQVQPIIEQVEVPELEDVTLKKENVNLSIDEAKENKIVEKLLALEEKLEYLNADFTLSYVAKKVKTNTTYLSYIVNKRFGKSFGEYSNELKINYVINQMITNHLYRKYSTQAIAESVGFKNAVSFAKSFRKRTGVSPAQFANNI